MASARVKVHGNMNGLELELALDTTLDKLENDLKRVIDGLEDMFECFDEDEVFEACLKPIQDLKEKNGTFRELYDKDGLRMTVRVKR